MDELSRNIFWESFSFHAAWGIPVILGLGVVLYALKQRNTHNGEAITYSCFAWALLILLIGFGGAYWNWQLLMDQAGFAGDVSWEAFEAGLLRTYVPAFVGLLEAAGLFTLATVLRYIRKG